MTRAKNRRKSSWLKKWIVWINSIFVLLLLLTYITPYVRVEAWGWLSLLALAYPFIMFVNGLFALGWIFFRSWLAILSIVAILAGFSNHIRYIKLFSAPLKEAECPESIRLMSYNLRGMSMIPSKSEKDVSGKIDSLYKAIGDLREFPDILCLQEVSNGKEIADRFGMGHALHASKSSLWMLSRFPVIANGEIEGEETSPSAMWADLKTPQGIIRVYNMHLVSNRVTNTTEELIQDMDLKNENTWNNIRFIVRRYRHTTRLRAIEARKVQDHVMNSPYPAILAGDGNDPPLSNVYHLLSKDLKDSFVDRGTGLSTTYASQLPLLRIDYLLGTSQIIFKDHHTYHLNFSDHYPITAGICINKAAGS
jgi:endonuclease/exonuclease/phosphatase family metal-dependent hydrolase